MNNVLCVIVYCLACVCGKVLCVCVCVCVCGVCTLCVCGVGGVLCSGKANDWRNRARVVLDLLSNSKWVNSQTLNGKTDGEG